MKSLSPKPHFSLKNGPPLGAHTSIAGGVFNAIYAGAMIGCDVIQIFSKNQMQWRGKPLTREEIEKFKQAVAATGVSPVVVHDSYLINLASPNKLVFRKSQEAVVDELQRCDTLGIPYLVMHPGSHLGEGEQRGMEQLAEALGHCYETSGVENPVVLLETTAGQGSNLGYTFEQLNYLLDRSGLQERIGVCLDTCHVFAAGYDLRNKKAWETTKQKFDDQIGLEKLKIIHANDSQKELGSRVDRHARIGDGAIGLKGFSSLVNDPDLQKIPFILEIPGGQQAFKQDLSLLRKLLKK